MKYVIIFATAILAFYFGRTNNESVIISHPTDYHFNVDSTGYDIYTEDMILVGRINYGKNPSLDSLIDADNQ